MAPTWLGLGPASPLDLRLRGNVRQSEPVDRRRQPARRAFGPSWPSPHEPDRVVDTCGRRSRPITGSDALSDDAKLVARIWPKRCALPWRASASRPPRVVRGCGDVLIDQTLVPICPPEAIDCVSDAPRWLIPRAGTQFPIEKRAHEFIFDSFDQSPGSNAIRLQGLRRALFELSGKWHDIRWT